MITLCDGADWKQAFMKPHIWRGKDWALSNKAGTPWGLNSPHSTALHDAQVSKHTVELCTELADRYWSAEVLKYTAELCTALADTKVVAVR